MMPALLERAGSSDRGSITGIYTVLVEGDDHNEPIADTARSILDGHIVLDRRLANGGHFPSIDVLQSVSRVAGAVTTPPQRELATELRRLLAARADVQELVQIGAYVRGTNPTADHALAAWPAIQHFLQQDRHELVPPETAWAQLAQALEHPVGGLS
jgi:flagellum-specific ATP synthase